MQTIRGLKIPIGKWQELMICHVGSAEYGCKWVFASKSSEGSDYNSEMNSQVSLKC